jgi:hypothetical protein
LLAAVLPEINTGIKIPTNPADRDCQILGAKALKTGNWTDLVNGSLRGKHEVYDRPLTGTQMDFQ